MTFSHHPTEFNNLTLMLLSLDLHSEAWRQSCIHSNSSTLWMRSLLRLYSNKFLSFTVEDQKWCSREEGVFGKPQVYPPFKLASLFNLYHIVITMWVVATSIISMATKEGLGLKCSVTILLMVFLCGSSTSRNKRFEGSEKFNESWMRNVRKFQKQTRVRNR